MHPRGSSYKILEFCSYRSLDDLFLGIAWIIAQKRFKRKVVMPEVYQSTGKEPSKK